MKTVLIHDSGIIKKVKLGYSWTLFFWGALVPLLRGDFKWTVILLLLHYMAGRTGLGLGISLINFLFAFFYNRIYVRNLLEKGYRPPENTAYAVRQYVNR